MTKPTRGFFSRDPGTALIHALVLQYAPVNTDILPTFVLLHLAFPGLLWLMTRSAAVVLAASLLLYIMVQIFSWHVPAWPRGELYFNPLAWQVLFVFGAWYAREGAGGFRAIVLSRIVLVLAIFYLAVSLVITLSWQIRALEGLVPDAVSRLIYPISKSHLAPLRLLHFLALAVVVSRLTAPDWHGLLKPWMTAMIRCGENSLAMYCFSVLLSFAGFRGPDADFRRFRHACGGQLCRHRDDGRSRDSADLGSQTGPPRAEAVLSEDRPTDGRYALPEQGSLSVPTHGIHPGIRVSDTFKPGSSRQIAVLGAPIDIGASQRGTLMGPAALRTAGLLTLLDGLGFDVQDHGDLSIGDVAELDGCAA